MVEKADELDREEISGPARAALMDGSAGILRWTTTPIRGGFGSASGGVFRIAGTALCASEATPWSIILKVVRPPTAERHAERSLDPTSMNYWRREPLVYQSGLLAELAPGLASPRCYQVQEGPDGTYRLWLEDLTDEYGLRWSIERYVLAARHLGRFNGAYLAGRALPPYPWLCTDFVRSWFVRFSHAFSAAEERESWEHALVRRAFPEPVADRVLRLLADRERFIAAIPSLPQTLCHHDARYMNLFSRRRPDGESETVAIDWALLGTNVVGAELGMMLFMSVFFAGVDAADVLARENDLFESYLDGLREAGWRVDRDAVRTGYATTMGLLFLAPTWLYHVTRNPDAIRALVAEVFGRTIDEMMPNWAALQYFVLDRGDEARQLLGLT